MFNTVGSSAACRQQRAFLDPWYDVLASLLHGPYLLLKTPHCIPALGLMHRMKLQVVESRVAFRSCIDAKKAFATVGFTRVYNKAGNKTS